MKRKNIFELYNEQNPIPTNATTNEEKNEIYETPKEETVIETPKTNEPPKEEKVIETPKEDLGTTSLDN